jgi:replicative DNA helicase
MDLLELIESYGHKTDQKGMEHWMTCPFHADSNPSFSVSPTEDGYVWYCFSCKNGGGPVQFIQHADGVGPAEAKAIWDKLNGRKPSVDPMRREQQQRLEEIQELPDEVIAFMAERHISEETLHRYKIGWTGDTIVYPFLDYDGVIKVHERGLTDKAYKGAKPNMLWGMYQIPYGTEEVWMVEGYHDVMALAEHDIYAVALSGTVIHSEYWKQLRDHNIGRVLLCPDGDAAGRALLEKTLKVGWPKEISLSYVALDDGQDPDDLTPTTLNDLVPEVPLLWYVQRHWEGHLDTVSTLRMYEDISQFVIRMSAAEREAVVPWFRKHIGDEAIAYLHGDVKPDLMSESVVIGNCLYSTSIRTETLGVLTEDCFHTKELRNEFVFIRDSDDPTPELFKSRFSSEPQVDLVNYRAYVDKVFEIRSRERVIRAMERARANVHSEDPESLVGTLVEDLYSFLDSDTLVHAGGDVARRVIIEVNEKVENPDVVGIPFADSFPIINRSLLGYVPSKLILLSGLTGHGKTNVACNWTDDLIFEKKQNVLWCSLEMTPEELVQRQLTIRSGIAGLKIMTGSLEQSEYDQLVKTAKGMLDSKLKILYGTYNLHNLVGIMRAQVMRNKVRVIFLDYVQLVSVDNDKARWEQLMDITKALKTRVCSLGVTVVAISQLNRSAMNSEVPEAAAQAGSFGMLADPDVAITIKRRAPEQGSNFLLYIDKHRYGVDQILVNAVFDRQTLQIKEVS